MFGNNYGVINWFLSLFGGKNINWLGGDGSLIKVAVIVMFAWKWVGWNMVIYLAGMQGISGDIYEAAKIDGASNTRGYVQHCYSSVKTNHRIYNRTVQYRYVQPVHRTVHPDKLQLDRWYQQRRSDTDDVSVK
ncbi:MAG: carbohydrate ABC transporter permease [Lachnospiraceae bacterium]